MPQLEPYEIDSSRMPVRLGSALRVPSYAYPAWGITGDEAWLRRESDEQYEREWAVGSPDQMKNVVTAITASGLGNYSQMLRDANAEAVCAFVQQTGERVNYLELGAGESTVTVYKMLKDRGVDLERVFGTLVEPSAQRLGAMTAKLSGISDEGRELGLNLKSGKNFKAYIASDVDVLKYVQPETHYIASYVAVLHHHAYVDTPLRRVRRALKNGGLLAVADWHNSMWEHPNRVYVFLRNGFDWPTKERDLGAFIKMHPRALETAPEEPQFEYVANQQIRQFWKSWADVKQRKIAAGEFAPEDNLVMLEAHVHVDVQNRAIVNAGFALNTPKALSLLPENPKRLVDGSGILHVTVAEAV